jgi:hypothetical protein
MKMKNMLMVIVSAIVSINLLYAVTELREISENLIYLERCVMLQNPVHEADVAVDEFQMSDEELVEILGL